MKKGISPLLATVILIALTLAVAALLGSWFTTVTTTQTDIIEEHITKQVNCSAALLQITDVLCSGRTSNIKITITNLGHDVELYNFSTLVIINNTYYLNNTSPNITDTDPLNPGEQAILSYYCDNNTYCASGVGVGKIRITPYNCPNAFAEKTFADKTC